MRRVLLILALLAVSCAGTSNDLVIVGSSPETIAIGPQRLILAWVDEDQAPKGGPDEKVTVIINRDGNDYTEVPGEWVWSIEGARGYYVAHVDFGESGGYEVSIQPDTGRQTAFFGFTVNELPSIPEVGQIPPRSTTKIYPDTPLEGLTTDSSPNPSFYEVTVGDAITSGRPALIVFASPAFCQTAVCGPTLDVVKQVDAAFPDLRVVHVEVYDNLDVGAQGKLELVDAVVEWNLPSEPWVYVIGAGGRVAARFEGAVSAEELTRALTAVGA